MKTADPKDFFNKYISVMSALVPEEYRLTWKEIEFLTECCIYQYEGHDLSDIKALTDHLLDMNFFTRKADVSTYKCKIGTKKWAVTGRDQFILPKYLNLKPGDKLHYALTIEFDESLSDR